MADTPQDSGEPLGEDTGSVAGSLDNLPESSMTSDTGGTIAKYDQAILAVHGIGKQKPGDTFKTVFDPIKEKIKECNFNIEILNDDSVKDGQGNRKPPTLEDIRISRVHSASKNIAMREVYWHDQESDSSRRSIREILWDKPKKIISMKQKARARIIKRFFKSWSSNRLKDISILLGVIQILLLKILQFRLSTISFLLIICFIAILSAFDNNFNINNNNNLDAWKPLESFFNDSVVQTVAIIVLIPVLLYVLREVSVLYRQVKGCNDGLKSPEAEKISKYIDEMLSKSQEIIIVGHSMGGYLSYETLSKICEEDDDKRKKVALVGLGSGLGPMRIIQEVTHRKLELNICYVLKMALILAIYVIAWTGVWLNLLAFSINPDGGSRIIGFSDGKFFSSTNFFCLDFTAIKPMFSVVFCIALLLFLRFYSIRRIYESYGPKVGQDKNISFAHREFYYLSDIVGNTSRFSYSKNIGQEMLGNPPKGIKGLFGLGNMYRRFIYSHDMGYYFENGRLVRFLAECTTKGIDHQRFYSKDSKSLYLWVAYSAGLLYAICMYGIRTMDLPMVVIFLVPLFLASGWFVYFVVYFVINLFVYYIFYWIHRKNNNGKVDKNLKVPSVIDGNNFRVYLVLQVIFVSIVPLYIVENIIDIIKHIYGVFPIAVSIIFALWIVYNLISALVCISRKCLKLCR